jgi:hypothetical protein
VFFGEATETGCRIYIESEHSKSAPLSGFVRGPFCQYAQTLPTNHPFRPASRPAAAGASGDDGSPRNLVEAWVPDPCFWTPAMPYAYEYRLEREVAGRRQLIRGYIGIRRLGREGGNLRLDGKRWVLRAAQAEHLNYDDLLAWRAASTAAFVDWRDSTSKSMASTLGLLLVAQLSAADDVEAALRELRVEASVGMVILDRRNVPLNPRSMARNLLFAQRFGPGETVHVDDWADVAICELDGQPLRMPTVLGRSIPLIALRRSGAGGTPQELRAACDLLQRDLAESGINWAGYIV